MFAAAFAGLSSLAFNKAMDRMTQMASSVTASRMAMKQADVLYAKWSLPSCGCI